LEEGFIETSHVLKLGAEVLDQVHDVLVGFIGCIGNILRRATDGELDVTVLLDEAIIVGFGSEVLNAGDPFITLLVVLSTENEVTLAFFVGIFLAPSTRTYC